jgi:DNA primase
MAVTDDIKARVDIVELIGESVQLRKTGRTFVGFCPFHSNTRTPAFTVYPDSQSYHCFGCKASGSVFDFVMARQGLDFAGSLKLLAERAGLKLEERGEAQEQQSRLRTRLLDINGAAANLFRHLLLHSPRGEAGRAYLAKRGLSAEAIESFQLGFAPDEWSLLLGYLSDKKGFDPDEVEAAGLAIRRENGGVYDRFRNRLMFPIRNVQGQIVGFGGRAIGDEQPKYLNTPQTPLFDKSSVLYGLDLARDAIRRENLAVLVEGYVDVITAHQHGFANLVAPLGTALSDGHIKLLKRFSSRVFLALDADAAGQRAMLKGLEKLQQAEDSDSIRAVETATGLVRFESDVELRIIALPPGQDPDEVIKAAPGQWRALVAQAQPVMDFYLQAYTADLDLSVVRDQTLAYERLHPLIKLLGASEQQVYLGKLSRLLPDLREEFFFRDLRPTGNPRQLASIQTEERPSLGRKQARPSTPDPPPSSERSASGDGQPVLGDEEHLLALLLRHPPARAQVEQTLSADIAGFQLVRQFMQGSIAELFERVENRLLWQSWQAQPAGRLVGGWLQAQPSELHEHGKRIVALAPLEQASYLDSRAALDCAKKLRQQLVARWQRRLAYAIAEAEDPAEQHRLTAQLVELQQYYARITRPPRSSTWTDLDDNRV